MSEELKKRDERSERPGPIIQFHSRKDFREGPPDRILGVFIESAINNPNNERGTKPLDPVEVRLPRDVPTNEVVFTLARTLVERYGVNFAIINAGNPDSVFNTSGKTTVPIPSYAQQGKRPPRRPSNKELARQLDRRNHDLARQLERRKLLGQLSFAFVVEPLELSDDRRKLQKHLLGTLQELGVPTVLVYHRQSELPGQVPSPSEE